MSEEHDELRKRKSTSRRSSILKRQDTCIISEGPEGSEGSQTPTFKRRVSFASTTTVRTFEALPWHLSDDSSCSSINHNVTNSESSSEDDVFRPHPILLPTADNNSNKSNVHTPDLEDHPQIPQNGEVPQVSENNKTIMFSNLNDSDCAMEITTNVSQLSSSWFENENPDLENIENSQQLKSNASSGVERADDIPPKIFPWNQEEDHEVEKTRIFLSSDSDHMEITCNPHVAPSLSQRFLKAEYRDDGGILQQKENISMGVILPAIERVVDDTSDDMEMTGVIEEVPRIRPLSVVSSISMSDQENKLEQNNKSHLCPILESTQNDHVNNENQPMIMRQSNSLLLDVDEDQEITFSFRGPIPKSLQHFDVSQSESVKINRVDNASYTRTPLTSLQNQKHVSQESENQVKTPRRTELVMNVSTDGDLKKQITQNNVNVENRICFKEETAVFNRSMEITNNTLHSFSNKDMSQVGPTRSSENTLYMGEMEITKCTFDTIHSKAKVRQTNYQEQPNNDNEHEPSEGKSLELNQNTVFMAGMEITECVSLNSTLNNKACQGLVSSDSDGHEREQRSVQNTQYLGDMDLTVTRGALNNTACQGLVTSKSDGPEREQRSGQNTQYLGDMDFTVTRGALNNTACQGLVTSNSDGPEREQRSVQNTQYLGDMDVTVNKFNKGKDKTHNQSQMEISLSGSGSSSGTGRNSDSPQNKVEMKHTNLSHNVSASDNFNNGEKSYENGGKTSFITEVGITLPNQSRESTKLNVSGDINFISRKSELFKLEDQGEMNALPIPFCHNTSGVQELNGKQSPTTYDPDDSELHDSISLSEIAGLKTPTKQSEENTKSVSGSFLLKNDAGVDCVNSTSARTEQEINKQTSLDKDYSKSRLDNSSFSLVRNDQNQQAGIPPADFEDPISASPDNKLTCDFFKDGDMLDEDCPVLEDTSIPLNDSFKEEELAFSYIRSIMETPVEKAARNEKRPEDNNQENLEFVDICQVMGIDFSAEQKQEVSAAKPLSTSSLEGKLGVNLFVKPEMTIMNSYIQQLQEESLRNQQNVKERLKKFSCNPPKNYVTCQNAQKQGLDVSAAKSKSQEMAKACQRLARGKHNRHKADYLMQLTLAQQTEHEQQKRDLEMILSDIERVANVSAEIDKCLEDLNVFDHTNSEVKQLSKRAQEMESETSKLRLHCDSMDKQIQEFNQAAKDTKHRLKEEDEEQELLIDKISFMACLSEWSLRMESKKRLMFGFLFNTVIVDIRLLDGKAPHQRISDISFKSKLSSKCCSWAKIAHTLMLSSLDRDALMNRYEDFSQLNSLLAHLSDVAGVSRELCSELKTVHFKHHLSIDGLKIQIRLFSHKHQQKVEVKTTLKPGFYPVEPLIWEVNVVMSPLSSASVVDVLSRVKPGAMYITRSLEAVLALMST